MLINGVLCLLHLFVFYSATDWVSHSSPTDSFPHNGFRYSLVFFLPSRTASCLSDNQRSTLLGVNELNGKVLSRKLVASYERLWDALTVFAVARGAICCGLELDSIRQGVVPVHE
jgi:hypothetical protein